MNQVTLTLESYNRLLLENSLLKRMLLVRRSWNQETIELEIDPRVAEEIVVQLATDSGFDEQYVLRPAGEWYHASTTVGQLKPEFIAVDNVVVSKPKEVDE